VSLRFRFNARAGVSLYKPPGSPPTLSIGFTLPKPATSQPDPIALRMLQDGMLALPEPLQGLSRDDLAERGYHFVKWHSGYKRRYVPLVKKRHDT
jgi:hypothetical protein